MAAMFCLRQSSVSSLLLAAVCFLLVDAAPEADRVLSLPGLDPQPTFNHYAGYLNATGGKHFFYWFVESERSPETDPLVLWLNGGPGCSSLTGLLAELGPWRTKPDGSGLTWFEHRWNKIANVIFLESPQCVGYSYSDSGLCVTGDNQVAHDNHNAIKDFFVKFPEYVGREFYITGESYAGIYVPTLSALIVDDPEINFKGMAIGNSVTDRVTMNNGYPFFAWGRGLIGSDLWNEALNECCVERNASNCVFYQSSNPRCRTVYARIYNVQWNLGLNPYSLYEDCYGGVPNSQGIIRETADELVAMVPELALRMDDEQLAIFQQRLYDASLAKNVTVRIPCSDTSDRETYLNRPDVREALHVSENVEYWLPCSSLTYARQYENVRAEYYKVLERGYRVLVYYGDFDMACDHLSGMWFTESLDVTVVEPFKQWFYPDSMGYRQIAGFVIQFENMNFVSIKGAGHFVPTDKELPAFMMFEKFLTGEPY